MKTSILIGLVLSVLFSRTLAAAENLPTRHCSAVFDMENNCLKDVSNPAPSLPELLTSYLVDRSCEEQEGKEWQCRKNLLVEYENYAASGREISPKDLRRDDLSSKPTFDRKESMVLHMLENLVGKDLFFRVLREFATGEESRRVSWGDLKIAFEKASDKDLKWFFDQWVNRKGIPSIEIKDPKIGFARDVRTVSFEIVQKSEPFRLDLPLIIKTDKGEVVEVLKIEKEKETFEIPVRGNPSEIVFDRDYDLLRRLSEEERPPVISGLLGDEKQVIVIPGEGRETYEDLIESVKGKGTVLKDESKITDEDIKKNSLLVLGCDSPVLKRLFGGFQKPDAGFSMRVKKNPLNESKVVAIACADSREEIAAAIGQLSGYAGYSYVRFKKGRNVAKDTAETERGISVSLAGPLLGIQPRKAMGLDEIILKVLDKPLIYVGERHANFEDHRVELEVIMRLYESGRKLAIGMEMFQRPFQRTIDAYLSGGIGEREFLKETQYFKRWQFDYNLYREIIEYAKAKGIPVIALNMWSEIVKTVAAGGLDALTDSEKAQIFPDMDMSDDAYKQRLREVFDTHKNHSERDFDNFYQAQILWDETMAHSADEFLKKNPDYQMVVLAGVGHIIYGSGIPKRAFRLNGKDYATLIPAIGVPDEDSADFVLFPEHLSPPVSAKLGIILKKTNGNVRIEKIQPASSAENAGLKKDDVIVSLDSWTLEDVDDARIYLFDKKKGEKIKIKVLRKKFLAGYKEMEFNVSL